MIRHLLNLSFRNFARHKTSFLVNLTSLSVGLACVVLIYLWVADELNVDKFFENDTKFNSQLLPRKLKPSLKNGENLNFLSKSRVLIMLM